MRKIEIPEKSITVEFASELEEMSNKQFQRYVWLIMQYDKKLISETEFRSQLVQSLLDLGSRYKYAFFSLEKKNSITTNITRLSALIDSFIEEFEKDHKIVKSFKLKSTRNFVPRILSYYGPDNCFENLSFCEYRIARNYFRQFIETNDEQFLNYLIAVLYRPAKPFTFFRKWFLSWNGEIRIPFLSANNPIAFENRAKQLKKVPFHLRYCVFLYFAGCEQFIKSGTPVVDGIELDFSQLYSDTDSNDKANVGMIGLLYSLSESGVFGTIEQTDKQNLWDVLVRVYQLVMQSQVLSDKAKSYDPGKRI